MRKQDVAKEGGLKPKVNVVKYVLNLIVEAQSRNCCNSNVSQTGVWGRGPQPPEAIGDFLKISVIFRKIVILMAFGSHFARF